MLKLDIGHVTPAGREHPLFLALAEYAKHQCELDDYRAHNPYGMAGGASFNDYNEAKVLELITGKTAFTTPTFWLALCTTAPTDASTGTTIVEAAYTGYTRLKIEGTKWTVSGTSPTAIKTNEELKFAACTASSSTVIAWAGCDATTTGNALCWGTATSTVISTTQTPATIASGGLEITLD